MTAIRKLSKRPRNKPIGGRQFERQLVSLVRRETPESIRSGIIHAWAAQNHVAPAKLNRARVIRDILDAGDKQSHMLFQRPSRAEKITLKQVERVFELVLEQSPRRKQGAVYTPEFVVDYLIKVGLRFLTGERQDVRFCDPACGCGGFLLRAAKIVSRQFRLSIQQVLERQIRGLDNDPSAVDHSRCLLSLFLLQHDAPHELATRCVLQGDSLLLTASQLNELTGFGSGIDLLATNPPYVKLQNLDRTYRHHLVERFPEFAKGSFSLSLLFLIAGHRMLSDRGSLAFITQNNLFTSIAGKPVRQYLQTHGALRRIVDFQHHRVFEDASAYTCLLFLGATKKNAFQFEQLRGPIHRASLRAAEFATIQHDWLEPKKWRLAKQPHLRNLQRIEKGGIPLGELAKISVGFATLKDAVFMPRGQCDHSSGLYRTGDGHEIELDATRCAVKVAEMKDESDLAQNQRRIIFPYERRSGRWSVIPEDRMRSRFPAAYAYLEMHRDLLDKRDKGRREYDTWYGWARTQGRDAPGPKLLTKTFSRRPNFMLDPTDQLFCNGYGVSVRQSHWPVTEIGIGCLQRILNSAVMDYYAKLTSFHIEGDYQCYQKNFIERFSVPRLSSRQMEVLLRCDERDFSAILAAFYGFPPGEMDEILSVPQSLPRDVCKSFRT